MSNKTLEYKGFQGSVNFDLETNVLHGKILHINDLVSYEAESVDGLNKSFIEAVEDYLETCELLGVEPEKPFSGSFNIRIGQELHKDLAKFSARHGSSINDVVKEAINCHVNGRHNEIHHHHYPVSEYETRDFIRTTPIANRPKLRIVQ